VNCKAGRRAAKPRAVKCALGRGPAFRKTLQKNICIILYYIQCHEKRANQIAGKPLYTRRYHNQSSHRTLRVHRITCVQNLKTGKLNYKNNCFRIATVLLEISLLFRIITQRLSRCPLNITFTSSEQFTCQ